MALVSKREASAEYEQKELTRKDSATRAGGSILLGNLTGQKQRTLQAWMGCDERFTDGMDRL